jgi:hypothetical protein
VLSLTGTEEGRTLLLKNDIPAVLCRLVGDLSEGVAENAVKALVNLSADGELMQSLLKEGMISKLMESLRDSECTWKRYVVMLIANLSQTDEGCIQLLFDASTVKGLHLRRLIQYIVAPVVVPLGGRYSPMDETEAPWDAFEYVGDVIANATRLEEARRILLEPERRILPVIFPLLTSPSVIRRRGAAATLRNCCFEKDEGVVRYMLSPSVDVITALLGPLVGPDAGQYPPEDRDFMNPALFKNGARRVRESDPFVRRQLLESLLLMAGTRAGRDALRRVRAYPIVKDFHQWLEGEGAPPAAGGAGDAATPAEGEASQGPDEEDETPLHAHDEAGVVAINALVQQLFRDDEWVWPSDAAAAAAGARKRVPGDSGLVPSGVSDGGAAAASGSGAEAAAAGGEPSPSWPPRKPVDETGSEGLAGLGDRATAKAAVAKRMTRFATVPLAAAREAARSVATGAAYTSGTPVGQLEDGPGALRTVVPEWTNDDPDMPAAFKAQPQAVAEEEGPATA